jgi:large subunit ribosomal protein L3
MSIGILGTKIGMTQIFEKNGNLIPTTIVKCGPCYVTKIKNIENSGYNAIQIGYLKLFKKNTILGINDNEVLKYHSLKEYKIDNISEYYIGQEINVDILKENSFINVSGITIGKGYSGNIKKNHFSRGPMSHGSKHHRLQGSIGSGTTPGRVFPGKKMSGHLGSKCATIKNIKIIKIYKDINTILIKGSIPGKKGTLVNIKI